MVTFSPYEWHLKHYMRSEQSNATTSFVGKKWERVLSRIVPTTGRHCHRFWGDSITLVIDMFRSGLFRPNRGTVDGCMSFLFFFCPYRCWCHYWWSKYGTSSMRRDDCRRLQFVRQPSVAMIAMGNASSIPLHNLCVGNEWAWDTKIFCGILLSLILYNLSLLREKMERGGPKYLSEVLNWSVDNMTNCHSSYTCLFFIPSLPLMLKMQRKQTQNGERKLIVWLIEWRSAICFRSIFNPSLLREDSRNNWSRSSLLMLQRAAPL